MAGAAVGDNQQLGWEGTAGTSLVTMVLLPGCAGRCSLHSPARALALSHGVGCGGHVPDGLPPPWAPEEAPAVPQCPQQKHLQSPGMGSCILLP